MKPQAFDPNAIPSPYREILERELQVLEKRENVVAVGLMGSVARGDTWIGSDLDLEVIVKGDEPTKLVLTEKEVSVDYVYISEENMSDLFLGTIPVYDPKGVIGNALPELDEKRVLDGLKKEVRDFFESASRSLKKANSVLDTEPHSALCFTHLTGMYLGLALTLAVTKHLPGRRPVSRLEMITKKISRPDLLDIYLSLYGMPSVVSKAELLLRELEEGLREIWGYFRNKKVGPLYMIQQPESGPYFRNRMRPIYEYDKRDFVRIVYTMFPCIILELFRSVGEDDFPDRIFYESQRFKGPAADWTKRYRMILELIPEEHIPALVSSAERLHQEIQLLCSLSKS